MCSLNESTHHDWNFLILERLLIFFSSLHLTPYLSGSVSTSWPQCSCVLSTWPKSGHVSPSGYFPAEAAEKGPFPSWVIRCTPNWSGAMCLVYRKQSQCLEVTREGEAERVRSRKDEVEACDLVALRLENSMDLIAWISKCFLLLNGSVAKDAHC